MKKILVVPVLFYFLKASSAMAIEANVGTGGANVGSGGPNVGRSGGLTLPNPLGSDSILQIIKNITGWLIGLSIPIASVMILYAGYQIMFAKGDVKKVQEAYKTITYSLIGLAIIVLSWALVGLLQQILGV